MNYIINHLSIIRTKTIDEVANELFVSTATISRTAKHLGYQGFKELKYAINQARYVENQEENIPRFQLITNRMISNVTEIFQQLSERKIKQLIALIDQSHTIEVLGLGGSFPICTDFARKLTFLGKKAFASSDWDEQKAAINNLNQKDLAIFISFTGETTGILTYAQIACKRKIPIVSIVSTNGSSLENYQRLPCLQKDLLSIIRLWI